MNSLNDQSMASVKRFEDLICWRVGLELVREIYRISNLPSFTDFSLKDQLRRAVISVISNIAEGFERGMKEVFIAFLFIAKGSCGEVRCQLYAAKDLGFITQQDFEKAFRLAKRVSALIYQLIESLKGSTFKGLRYKIRPVEKKDVLEEMLRKDFPDVAEKLYGKT